MTKRTTKTEASAREASTLSAFSKGLDEASKRKEQERIEFNARLGEPAVFVPDDMDAGDSRFGVGYWKAEGGVISYRKYANGYDPFSRHEYEDALIDLLVKVSGKPVRGS